MKKIVLLTTAVCIILALLACYNFAQNDILKDDNAKKMALMEAKTKSRLSDAYNDIKKSHKIDENLYTDINQYGGLEALSTGKITGFDDSEYNNLACNIIYQESKNFEIGSLKPLVLLKNDKTEILICTKNQDGKNKVVKYDVKKDGSWERSEKSVNGKSILDNGQY